MPPPSKIPRKYWMYGAAILIPIVQYGVKAIIASFTPEPRMCPKCSFKTVSEVGRRLGRDQKPAHYWRCSACAARYKTSLGDGPFTHAPEQEWSRYVRFRFPR